MKYNINDLLQMLSYQRGQDTVAEKRFITKYIDSISGISKDGFGNRYKRVGSSNTAFSSHTDTVHSSHTSQGQDVYVKGKYAMTDGHSILGADDGTGVWLMLNMLHSGVPGLYVFHRMEEHGGRGSDYIAKTKLVGSSIKKAVAFDRRGYSDIITHQSGRRTCSDEFAKALAKQLGGSFKPSSEGSFTDTKNYSDYIAECTNVSIGYTNAHSNDEIQDLQFAEKLIKKLIRVNWQSLPVVRKPGENDWKPHKTDNLYMYQQENKKPNPQDMWNYDADFWTGRGGGYY